MANNTQEEVKLQRKIQDLERKLNSLSTLDNAGIMPQIGRGIQTRVGMTSSALLEEKLIGNGIYDTDIESRQQQRISARRFPSNNQNAAFMSKFI